MHIRVEDELGIFLRALRGLYVFAQYSVRMDDELVSVHMI